MEVRYPFVLVTPDSPPEAQPYWLRMDDIVWVRQDHEGSVLGRKDSTPTVIKESVEEVLSALSSWSPLSAETR